MQEACNDPLNTKQELHFFLRASCTVRPYRNTPCQPRWRARCWAKARPPPLLLRPLLPGRTPLLLSLSTQILRFQLRPVSRTSACCRLLWPSQSHGLDLLFIYSTAMFIIFPWEYLLWLISSTRLRSEKSYHHCRRATGLYVLLLASRLPPTNTHTLFHTHFCTDQCFF